jgi:hypothetical protein
VAANENAKRRTFAAFQQNNIAANWPSRRWLAKV